jgi:hypothetical protein
MVFNVCWFLSLFIEDCMICIFVIKDCCYMIY